MRISLLTLFTIVLVGCPTDEPAPEDDDTTAADDDDSEDLLAEIVSTYPEDGATDAYYRTDIEVIFDRAVGNVAIALAEDVGAAITGDLTVDRDDTRATFDPYGDDGDGHLTPLASYTATITWDDHEPVELHFQTSEVGTPVGDPEAQVVGHDYVLDLGTGTFTEPPGVGELTSQNLTSIGFGFRIESIDGNNTEAIGAQVTLIEDTWHQDLCTPSLDWHAVEPGFWDNPYLRLGPVHAAIESYPYYADWPGLTIGGSFSADGQELVEGILDAFIVVEDVGLDPHSPGATCDVLATLGIECVECPHDPSEFCLRLAARNMAGERSVVLGVDPETGETVTGLTEVTAEMVDAWEAAGLCP